MMFKITISKHNEKSPCIPFAYVICTIVLLHQDFRTNILLSQEENDQDTPAGHKLSHVRAFKFR